MTEVVLVQSNLVDNQYQQKSEVSYTFTPNKFYEYFLNVDPSNVDLVLLETYDTVFDDITIIFTDKKK